MPVTPSSQFASDNSAGICPEAWDALAQANPGYAVGYGNDPWTARAADKIRDVFETDCEVFFTFNGTAANALALAAVCQSYHSVICGDIAHIEVDECGAPEFFSNGSKLLIAPTRDGKINPADIAAIAKKRTDIHYPKPSVVSITQATEVGTVYSVDELRALGDVARAHDITFHMDGARFANALVSLAVTPKEITWQAGVDVLCLGGTKNGMAVGDAVVFFKKSLAFEFDYRCKQAGQLASKMRYLAAPWAIMLTGGSWLTHARHANSMAQKLHDRLIRIPRVEIAYPRQANALFLRLPPEWSAKLRAKGWHYYDFIAKGGARLMCSWATTDADIDAFITDLEACAKT